MPKPVRVLGANVKDHSVLAFAKMVRLLTLGELTCAEIAVEADLTKLTVYRYCGALYNEGVLHIAGWKQDRRGYYTIRVFKVGPEDDVPSPNVNKRSAKRAAARVRRQRTTAIPFPSVPPVG